MKRQYRPYPNPYDAPLGPAPLGVRVSIGIDRVRRFICGFYQWFFERLDWRRMDRIALEFLSFLIAVVAVYVAGLMFYCFAILVAVAYGAWPL